MALSSALAAVRLGEAVAHGLVLLRGAKAVGLHLALDDVKGVAAEPEGLAGEAAVQGDLPAGHVLAVDGVAGGVGVHHVLEGEEPHAVGLGLAQQGDGLAAVEAAQDAALGGQRADAVEGSRVEAAGAVGLRLQADADVLDGAGEGRVGEAGKGAGGVVLAVGERVAGVARLEVAARLVEGAKLDRHAGADADERRQRALVEGERALILVDGRRRLEGRRVRRRRLEADLDDVEGLADEDLGDAAGGAREEILGRLQSTALWLGSLVQLDVVRGRGHGRFVRGPVDSIKRVLELANPSPTCLGGRSEVVESETHGGKSRAIVRWSESCRRVGKQRKELN
ncbi:hypothetical protein BN1723_011363 [Verticillium longisporum]|uniref:Uncharacterized protein n=1 Tax=Verticillium longisporum TaxID=100787 RepID=A0A0G4L6I8_VERLO|nr:hypothetical protein BN1723_011363 [Verticillium longisporum]